MPTSEETSHTLQAAAARAGGEVPRHRLRRLLALVFGLALAMRLAYTLDIRDLPTQSQLVMDAQRYDELARQILARGWRPREPFYQAPLYPYLLAAVYAVSAGSLLAVRLAQSLAGAFTAVLAAIAAARACRRADLPAAELDRRQLAAAALAGVAAALYAPAIFYTPLLLKTVPALLLESAALVLLLPPAGRRLTAARCCGAGAALGAAALLQESLLLLVPAAALWVASAAAAADATRARSMVGTGDATAAPGGAAVSPDRAAVASGGAAISATGAAVLPAGGAATPAEVAVSPAGAPSPPLAPARRPLAAALALVGGAALALAPAALLNYAAGGELLLTSSQGGMNFFIGNARGATGTYSGLASGSQTPERQKADARRLAAAFAARDGGRPVADADLTPAQVSRIFWRQTLRQIAADPGAWLRLLLRKTRLFWNAYEIPDAEGFGVYRAASAVLRFDPVTFGVLAPLAAVGLLALWRGSPAERRAGLLLALLAAAAWVAVALFFVFGRYRLAVVPFLLPLAAAGAIELYEVCVPRRRDGRPTEDAARPGGRAALNLALLAAAALAVGLPCFPAAEIRRQDAVIDYNLGTAALRQADAAHAALHRDGDESPPPGTASPAAGRRRLAEAVILASRAAAYCDAAARASPGFFAAELEWATALGRRGSWLAKAGQLDLGVADYTAARGRLATALAAGHAGGDAELEGAARTLLGELDAGTAAALNNLGVRLVEAGQLDRAEAALSRAATLAPNLPGPRGSLALCWLRQGLAARRRGAEVEALDLIESSRRSYRQAVRLATAANRPDLAALYRQGLALAEAQPARQRQGTTTSSHEQVGASSSPPEG